MAKVTSDGTVFTNKTATFTSPWIPIEEFELVGLHFIAAGISSGNGVFSIDGSMDGSTVAAQAVTGISFQDSATTAVGTFITSKTLSSNGGAGAYLVNCSFRYIRVVVAVTTDGSYSCNIGARRSNMR